MKRLILGLVFACLCGAAFFFLKPQSREIVHVLRSDADVWGVIENREGKPWVILAGNEGTAFPYQRDLLTYRTAFNDDRVRETDLPVILRFVGDDIITIWRARDGSRLWPIP